MLVVHLHEIPRSAPWTWGRNHATRPEREGAPAHLFDALDGSVLGDGFGQLFEEVLGECAGEVDVGGGVESPAEVCGDALDVGRGGGHEVDGGNVWQRRPRGVQLAVGVQEAKVSAVRLCMALCEGCGRCMREREGLTHGG